MEIPDQLRCLFSAQVDEQDGSYVIEVPSREIQLGDIRENETYRVAVLPSSSTGNTGKSTTESEAKRGSQTPPVEEGEQRDVEIENIGEQGDGIARVERGFVVIIPTPNKASV